MKTLENYYKKLHFKDILNICLFAIFLCINKRNDLYKTLQSKNWPLDYNLISKLVKYNEKKCRKVF